MTNHEINEQVAVKLGWKINKPPYTYGKPIKGDKWIVAEAVPRYCHSIEAAWEILEFVDGWKLEGSGDKVSASLVLDDSLGAFSKADTAPMAICNAFLALK